MAALENPAFSFSISTLSPRAFEVVSFTGEEAISTLYSFNILLISDEGNLDMDTALQGLPTFSINPPFAGPSPREYTGIIAAFEALHQIQDKFLYRVEMRHKFWRLAQTRQNRVYLEQTPQQFLAAAMESEDLHSGVDYDMRLQGSSRKRDFVCQYNESTFAFVSRWLESLGMYYWFEHTDTGGSLVITDSRSMHTPVRGSEKLTYAPPSGMNPTQVGTVITHFSRKLMPLPKEVRLKTYNPQKPSLDLTCISPVKRGGSGIVYSYGDTYLDKNEGEALADIRAEELLCQENRYSGISHIPAMCPGFTFTLEKHFRSEWNQTYMTTQVGHQGSQTRQVLRAYSLSELDDNDKLFYRNTFTCIPASLQYRSPRLTPWPKVHGAIPAVIVAEGSSTFAMLDSQGRYKIIMPFDVAGRADGKSSCWISMAQPYAGEGMGFHAPLHKGTEVLLIFLDGNPDCPVIIGAVPNPETPSVVNDTNAAQICLDSASGFQFKINDTPNQEYMQFSSPGGGAFIRLGKKA